MDNTYIRERLLRIERVLNEANVAADALYELAIKAGADPKLASHYAHDLANGTFCTKGTAKILIRMLDKEAAKA